VGLPTDEAIEPEEIEQAKIYYTNDYGVSHVIREMPEGYLQNAVRKLKRSGRTDALTITTIEAMDKEVERRLQVGKDQE
jgi:hypothetical protein